MKKWGTAFKIVASGKEIGQSILALQLTYLNPDGVSSAAMLLQDVIPPCLVIASGIFIIIYLLIGIFANRF